ncbi:hypothetical protein [Marinobacter bohaiensis]|uniref:hypothetical protein n=1 Tax=Marinobacter bohaiensis TaxID=2201898 RepID=UPI0013A69091|nr:hypothetical protein [Marinobacter bohaiensis]
MWALIQNGTVAEITDMDPVGRYHPALHWEPCSSDVSEGWNWDGEVFSPPAPPEPRSRELLKADIDRAAGRARARFVSPGDLVEQEYREAERAAQQWQDAGEPSDAVPSEVQVWADAAGMSASAAAQDIIQTGHSWRGVLSQVRSIRLQGKAAVDAAADSDAEAVAQGHVDQLDALGPE